MGQEYRIFFTIDLGRPLLADPDYCNKPELFEKGSRFGGNLLPGGAPELIIDRSGREYLDTDIKQGLDNTLQMWMHDPDGNLFEIMEFTSESYQVVGRE